MFRIQEGKDPGEPQTEVERISGADKKKLIGSILKTWLKITANN